MDDAVAALRAALDALDQARVLLGGTSAGMHTASRRLRDARLAVNDAAAAQRPVHDKLTDARDNINNAIGAEGLSRTLGTARIFVNMAISRSDQFTSNAATLTAGIDKILAGVSATFEGLVELDAGRAQSSSRIVEYLKGLESWPSPKV